MSAPAFAIVNSNENDHRLARLCETLRNSSESKWHPYSSDSRATVEWLWRRSFDLHAGLLGNALYRLWTWKIFVFCWPNKWTQWYVIPRKQMKSYIIEEWRRKTTCHYALEAAVSSAIVLYLDRSGNMAMNIPWCYFYFEILYKMRPMILCGGRGNIFRLLQCGSVVNYNWRFGKTGNMIL